MVHAPITAKAADAEGYDAVDCPACRWTHAVNLRTGKILSEDDIEIE